MSVLILIGVVLVVIALVHLYLWKRLVRDTTAGKTRARRAGGVTISLLAVSIPVTLVGGHVGPAWISLGYLWLPLMFYLLLALLVAEIPMLGLRRFWAGNRTSRTGSAKAPTQDFGGQSADAGPDAKPAADQPAAERPGGGHPAAPPAADPLDYDPRRRLLLARGAAIFAGLTAASCTGYGVRTALRPPSIDRVRVPLAKLPRGMDGFRIAVVSDIHLGPLAGRAHAQRIVTTINSLDADLITIVGDLVDGTVAELGSAARPLRELRSPHGVYFVTGNHEYYSGVDEWLAELPELGIRVLRNERLEIEGLDLAGVDDITASDAANTSDRDSGGTASGSPRAGSGMGVGSGSVSGGGPRAAPPGPDYAAALAGRDPARPVVLLAHQPIQAYEAAKHGVDLQLSGHTHGGQMAPLNLLVRLQQPMVAGLGEVDGVPVYVSNGAGFWGPPVRVGAPPQVGLVELRAG